MLVISKSQGLNSQSLNPCGDTATLSLACTFTHIRIDLLINIIRYTDINMLRTRDALKLKINFSETTTDTTARTTPSDRASFQLQITISPHSYYCWQCILVTMNQSLHAVLARRKLRK